jgi:hypothetical protein
MSVLDAEMASHEELLNYHLSLLRLEESTGVPLMDDDPPDEPAGMSAAGDTGRSRRPSTRRLRLGRSDQTG